MPGNKAPRRKRAGVRTNTPESREKAYQKALQQKAAMHAKLSARDEKRNNLPLSHPMNSHMIDKTYAPLERHLDEHEKTGRVLVSDLDGAPMFYDGEQWIAIIPGMLHMCFVFEAVGRARVWPKMPPGLRAYAIGLQIGRTIDADDFKGARETIAWMRKHLGTLTPTKWSELFNWAITLDGGELEPGAVAHG